MTEHRGQADGTVELILSVPAGMRCQLIYRQERSGPFNQTPIEGHRFRLVGFPTGLVPILGSVVRAFGWVDTAKAVLKLLTRKRRLYLFAAEGRLSHYGWVSVGFCNHYDVEPGDVVLGPIWTNERDRGLGLATEALKRVMNAMMAEGHSVFFIDTGDDNVPCQRAIEKASFPPASGAYMRGKREGHVAGRRSR